MIGQFICENWPYLLAVAAFFLVRSAYKLAFKSVRPTSLTYSKYDKFRRYR